MNYFQAAVLLLTASSISTQSVYYVCPSSQNCPVQPCLTLNQYAEQEPLYFTTGSTFLFLAGNHTASRALNLTDVSGVTLKGNDSSCILYHGDFTISCKNTSHLAIVGLAFVYAGKSNSMSSVLEILNSWNVLIANSTFIGSGDASLPLTRAVTCIQANVIIASCHFQDNTGDNGGSIHASFESNITLTGNIFTRNAANISGGAIFASKYTVLSVTGNSFFLNSALHNGGAVNCKDSWINLKGNNTFEKNSVVTSSGGAINISKGRLVTSGTVIFTHNSAAYGGGISLSNSSASLNGRLLMFRNNSAAKGGGALHGDTKTKSKPITITSGAQQLVFIDNKAKNLGGAVYVQYCSLTFGETPINNFHFINNSGGKAGGALFSEQCSVQLMGNTSFMNNRSPRGGAIRISNSNFTLEGFALFSENTGTWGGAIQMYRASALFSGAFAEFGDNTAEMGGAIYSRDSEVRFYTEKIIFSGNTATRSGGAVAVINGTQILSGYFINNQANECGGGVFVRHVVNIILLNINITNNTGCGVCVFYSKTSIRGNSSLQNNIGRFGGAIRFENSMVSFANLTTVTGNKAIFGGGIYSVYGRMELGGTAVFAQNSAQENGGAIFALGTALMLNKTVNFTFNSAKNGGAVYLMNAATVGLTSQTRLITSHNQAADLGGVVYYEDGALPSQCNFDATKLHRKKENFLLPYCFIRLAEEISKSNPVRVSSIDNRAGMAGHFLYGGLLDRCRILIVTSNEIVTNFNFVEFHAQGNTSRIVTSQPYHLCFCTSDTEYDCLNTKIVEAQRGKKFTVPLVSIDQMGSLVSTTVTAKTSANAWLSMNERIQTIDKHCTLTYYSLYSRQDTEELTLYPDGPCRDMGIAKAVINVTFDTCPVGFTQSGGECVCEKRLQKYHAVCDIDTETITRNEKELFWIGIIRVNNSSKGLVFYEACPLEYCRTGNVSISLKDLNSQCDHMHAGVLCGSCSANYSFMLGSSRCGKCPNNSYLALILPFAAAGVALVVFLTILRLTVATGMINSVILYANIVQVNKAIFFPIGSRRNILTTFIAWLNLDLGFETCFYNGMDAYAQTWLQFIFPVYVWVLISLIILTSRYSITVSKLIGKNPIAVLGTLLLMSYTKVVKIMIEVYSFARLDYPNNETLIVWLKDGSVPYMNPLHLFLTLVTTLVVFLLFLPYTLLLLLGYKLYHFTGNKYLKWLNRVKPLLDSHYAPYRSHTRCWTGFLLLVRCVLYTIFTVHSHALTNVTIVATFAAILALSWFCGKIYIRPCINMLEAVTYLNLLILSVATLAGFNSTSLVYSLIGIVFTTTIFIVIYHLSRLQMVAMCLEKILSQFVVRHFPPIIRNINTGNPVNPPRVKQVSSSEVCLREPLLDD